MIYKIFAFPENPGFDYQFKNGNWYKRKKGSKESFYVLDKEGQKKLNDYYSKKGILFNYSTGVKVFTALTIILIGYTIYKKAKLK